MALLGGFDSLTRGDPNGRQCRVNPALSAAGTNCRVRWTAGVRAGASTRAMLMSLMGTIAVALDGSARSGLLNASPIHIDLPAVSVTAGTQKASAIWGARC